MSAIDKRRGPGIGGSDVGAILGADPYRTPLDIYLRKMGEVESDPDNAAMYWGRTLEEVVAREYEKRSGIEVEKVGFKRHPEIDWMLGHVDRLAKDRSVVLECKTSGWSGAWGHPGHFDSPTECADVAPSNYVFQAMHYMALHDVNMGAIAVLISGRDYRIYTFDRDRRLEADVVQRLDQWWKDHVVAEVPPPATTPEEVQFLHPDDSGEEVVATAEVHDHLVKLQEVKAKLDVYNDMKREHEFAVKKFLGPGSYLVDEGLNRLASWKTQSARRFDVGSFRQNHPGLSREYTTTSKYRVLRVNKNNLNGGSE